LDKFSKVERKFDPNLEKQGKRDATYQWVFYGIGAAAITAATIVGSSDGSSPPGVALAPIAGLGTAGATLAGSF
jgi:hypothetical protein